jgi:elongation factor P
MPSSWLSSTGCSPPPDLRDFFLAWNGVRPAPLPPLDLEGWRPSARTAFDRAQALPELAGRAGALRLPTGVESRALRTGPSRVAPTLPPPAGPCARSGLLTEDTVMKIAQEIRAGNVIMHTGNPWVVLKTEYSRGGRNAATVRMKLKSLLNNQGTETVFKADDKMDQIVLEKKDCTYSYFADPMYVWMDAEYNQYEVEAENMGERLNYLQDGMPAEVVFYEGKAISVEIPTSLEREITWTEPAVKGDTSGKVLKPAKLATGFEIGVPIFVAQGDKVEIDTRTGRIPPPRVSSAGSERRLRKEPFSHGLRLLPHRRPLRMQPGLQRLDPRRAHLTHACAAARCGTEKKRVVDGGASRIAVPGFDAQPAIAAILAQAASRRPARRPNRWSWPSRKTSPCWTATAPRCPGFVSACLPTGRRRTSSGTPSRRCTRRWRTTRPCSRPAASWCSSSREAIASSVSSGR